MLPNVELTWFEFLIMMSVVVSLSSSYPPKWIRWRRSVFLIIFGLSLTVAGHLLHGYFQFKPLLQAIKAGDIGGAKQTLSKRPFLVQTRTVFDNETALHMAVRTGNCEMVRLLLNAGANVNAQDFSGATPLNMAAFDGNTAVAHVLLESGADVNIVGYRDKTTPLEVVAFRGNLKMVKLLLAHGADPTSKDGNGKTPLQVAKDEQQTDVVQVLSNVH